MNSNIMDNSRVLLLGPKRKAQESFPHLPFSSALQLCDCTAAQTYGRDSAQQVIAFEEMPGMIILTVVLA